jgi:hypothetical protein
LRKRQKITLIDNENTLSFNLQPKEKEIQKAEYHENLRRRQIL